MDSPLQTASLNREIFANASVAFASGVLPLQATVAPLGCGESRQFAAVQSRLVRTALNRLRFGANRAKSALADFGSIRQASLVLCSLLGLGSAALAADDSTAILFQDDIVRSYSIEFYGDTAWSTKLEAMWKADSGYLPARFSDGQMTLDSVGVRYKGNSSFTLAGNNPKKPLKIKFSEFKAQTYYGVKYLNLSNGIGDPTMLREAIGYAIARQILPAPRANFANVTLAGKAIGLYTQVEQADKTFLKRWYASAGGNLFKAGDNGAYLNWVDSQATSYSGLGDYELKTNETAADWTGFVRFVEFLNRTSDASFCADRAKFLDDENVAKFLAFNTVLSNFDSYNGSGRNWYMYQTDSVGSMRMIPWDLNQSFGAYGGASNAINISIDTVQAPLVDRPLFKRFLECPASRAAYFKWIEALVTGIASTDSVEALMIRDSAIIAAHVAADSNKYYPTSAWKTNLRANHRATEGLIPGLVSFSKSRNAAIGSQLPEFLGSGVRHASGYPTGLKLVRSTAGWMLEGLDRRGAGVVRWSTADGRRSGRAAFDGIRPSLALPIPPGIVIVSIATQNTTQNLVLHNSQGATP
jgi:hypothetical protein